MRALMALWLTRLQAALIRASTEMNVRALEALLPAPTIVAHRNRSKLVGRRGDHRHDPMDRALHEAAARNGEARADRPSQMLVEVATTESFSKLRSLPPIAALPVTGKAIAGVPDLMHHKYVIRDHASVWTGSLNWTDDAWSRQENAVAIVHSPAIAKAQLTTDQVPWQKPATRRLRGVRALRRSLRGSLRCSA